MLLSHAVVLAEARSYVAALADSTPSLDASLEYERVLLQLDWLYGGTVPPITVAPSGDRHVLYRVAGAAIRNLEEHAVDRLDLALCTAMLDAAWELDGPS
jgi:hypothetical protein